MCGAGKALLERCTRSTEQTIKGSNRNSQTAKDNKTKPQRTQTETKDNETTIQRQLHVTPKKQTRNAQTRIVKKDI